MNQIMHNIKIQDLVHTSIVVKIAPNHLQSAYNCGVDIGKLSANTYVYEYDEPIFSVEYIKMVCNLVVIFRNIYDNYLYTLRNSGYINNDLYSSISFHDIFNEVNDKFNLYITDHFLFEEVATYCSEIALETTTDLYDMFIDTLISILKQYVDINLLKVIIFRYNMKYLSKIYDDIMIQISNIFYCLY